VLYNKAREEALLDRVIRAGWRASSLCLYNPGLVLLSSQVTSRPVTPLPTSQALATLELIFTTPRSSQALYKAQKQLELLESLSRSTRLVLSKAGKAITEANTRAAQLKAEN
jgi:hypothetical protein